MENKAEKNEGFRYLLKNTGLLTISNFSSKLLVFLLVPLYTSVLTTEEYGIFDMVQTTISLLLPILTINIYDAVMRFCMDEDCDDKKVCGIGIKYVIISITCFTVLALINQQLGLIASLAQYTKYMIAFYITNVCNQFFIQYAKGKEEVKAIAIAGVANTGITLLLNILLLLYFKMGIEGFFLAYIFGQFFSCLFLIIKTKVWDNIDMTGNKELEKEMVAFSAPLILGAIGWWCNNASDKYVIIFMCGLAANGVFAVAYKIPSILTTLQQIFVQAWQISAVKGYGKEGSEEFYGKIFKGMNISMCAVCIMLTIATKPIAHLLYAKDFYAAWQYVPFLLVAGVFNSASGVLGPVLNANKNSKSLGISSLYGTAANLILNFLLIYLIGPQGAAIATAISSYLIYQLRKNALNQQIRFYDYKSDVISWIIIIATAGCEIYLSNYIIEAILALLFVAINFKVLKEFMAIISAKILKK